MINTSCHAPPKKVYSSAEIMNKLTTEWAISLELWQPTCKLLYPPSLSPTAIAINIPESPAFRTWCTASCTFIPFCWCNYYVITSIPSPGNSCGHIQGPCLFSALLEVWLQFEDGTSLFASVLLFVCFLDRHIMKEWQKISREQHTLCTIVHQSTPTHFNYYWCVDCLRALWTRRTVAM